MSAARAGAQSGYGVYAASKRMPSAASRSRDGVRTTGWPYAPVKNGTSWSAMTRRTFGGRSGIVARSILIRREERVRRSDPRVVAPAVLERPRLRLVVDVHEPEALRVAERPLEVVQEGPVAVAEDVRALVDRVRGRDEVVVDEAHAPLIVNRLGEDGAVLGDQHGRAVVAVHPDEHVCERGGNDRRAGLGSRDAVGEPARGLHALGDDHAPRPRRVARDRLDHARRVVVDAEIVGALGDRRRVAVA